MFNEVLDRHAPIRRKRIKHWYQPRWITPEILKAIHVWNKLHRKRNAVQYRIQRNKVKQMTINAKKHYYSDLFAKKNRNNSKKLWHCMKELSGSRQMELPGIMKDPVGT